MSPHARHSAADEAAVAPGAGGVTGDQRREVVESYRRLADVFHDVLSEESLDALLERIADTFGDLIPHDDLAIYEADESRRELRAVFARGRWSGEVIADEPFAFGEGITGWAVEHREPLLVNRADLDSRVRVVANTPVEPESLIAVPLIARGRLQGTLNIYRVGLQEFTDDEFRLAVRFGDAAALALDNAHIRAGLERQARTDPLTDLLNHRAFHEQVRTELIRASSTHGTVALVMLDLDDFKRVNDVYGHASGDEVLTEVAAQLRASIRETDSVCRIGGEEFAIIVPSGTRDSAYALAERLSLRVAGGEFGVAGNVTLSIGIAVGPEHAANPRDLIGCADVAMMTAKAEGKGRIVVFGESSAARPTPTRPEDGRSIAHLKMLQSLSGKISRLEEVSEIGDAIAAELRQLIDYHNCRVFLREGDELRPIAFAGALAAAAGSTPELQTLKVGEGVTGRVVATGEPLLIGDAARCPFALQIAGTEQIEESLLAVPLLHHTTAVGAIVVSKLGLAQFDAEDLRLLEVLAGHAAGALANAQLYEAARREAESAKALLQLSRELSGTADLDEIVERLAAEGASILGASHASVWLPDDASGGLRCAACWSTDPVRREAVLHTVLPPQIAQHLAEQGEPHIVVPPDYAALVDIRTLPLTTGIHAIAPIAIQGRFGSIAVAADSPNHFDERALQLLGGIASQARLAIGNALSFHTLETTFLATVEALANALEAKDAATSFHARWITDMALRVGEELGLDHAALKRVELGALLHDIGKIGIPASILSKPGPLTAAERRLIETHPEVGERILAPIMQLAEVCPIVRACHENWDGTGYPDGLRGEEIPVESRIIFACDAFHAMISDRPYRARLSVDEARERLVAGAGVQFDPRVVEICLRVFDELDGP
jgi:diguanylate cyclase (GGDEF)-like protein